MKGSARMGGLSDGTRRRNGPAIVAWMLLIPLAVAACDSGVGDGAATVFAPVVSASSQGRPNDLTATYFFGSSTTDAGNLAALRPIVPSPPYFDGRTSDGPVWAEYFAELLATDGAAASSAGGDNYSVGGARTGVVNFGFIPPITAQVEEYLQRSGSTADPRALYAFQPAANDLTAAIAQPTEVAKQTMADAVDFMEAALTQLYAAGARRFMVLTTDQRPTIPAPILADGTNLVDFFNLRLSQMIADFDGPGARIALFDLNGLVQDIRASPARYGLQVTDCSYMGKDFLTILGGDRTPDPCEPSVPVGGYLYFDKEHFTTAMHEIIAMELIGCHRYVRGAGSSPAVSRRYCVEGAPH